MQVVQGLLDFQEPGANTIRIWGPSLVLGEGLCFGLRVLLPATIRFREV